MTQSTLGKSQTNEKNHTNCFPTNRLYRVGGNDEMAPLMGKRRFANDELRRLIKALNKYDGVEVRPNTAHFIVSCPKGVVIISSKYQYMKPRYKDLAEAGVDINKLKELM